MPLQPDQARPNDGVLSNYQLYLKNNSDGTVDVLLYIPNGSIGLTLASHADINKTTLAALAAGTPGQVINQEPVATDKTPAEGVRVGKNEAPTATPAKKKH